MNRKLSMLTFIFLLIFLISAVSAADNENETLSQSISSNTSQDIYTMNAESCDEKLELNSDRQDEILTASKTATASKKKVTLKAPSISMYYKGGKAFTITVKDANKKPINKAKLQIQIGGNKYSATTNSKGTVSLNTNLKPGTYTVTTTFPGTSTYESASVKSTITIKSTIKCSDFSKYYKNTASYTSTFYDSKGKLLKNTAVKFKLNTKTYSVKTNSKGVAKLAIDLKPGTHSITSYNLKTSENTKKTVTINSLIQTKDMTMTYKDGSKFNVKILNSNGKASPNKKVTITVNGKTYTKTTDKKGSISLPIDLNVGSYTITTSYDGIKSTNKITVNKIIKNSPFIHSTLIPNYVNVTTPYVFYNSAYVIESGVNGIIKMPKYIGLTVQTAKGSQLFTSHKLDSIDSTVIGAYSYLIPFDGSPMQSDLNRNNLKKDGIIISMNSESVQIDYQSKSKTNVDMFGCYINSEDQNTETITYLQNDDIMAKVNIINLYFDESGLRSNLAKYYGKKAYLVDYMTYDEITNNNPSTIRFANTNEPVTYSQSRKYITARIPKEDLITKFKINGKEELEKIETITYGLSEKYEAIIGYEYLQSYAIINEKITSKIAEEWLSKSTLGYTPIMGIRNIHSMFLASLETAFLADALADNYSSEFGVKWERENTVTILGGTNLDKTYIHILNADMGMKVTGTNQTTVQIFKVMNSMYLPEIENYIVSGIFNETNTNSSLDNVLYSMEKNEFSIVRMGEIFYITCENDKNSTIVINSTSSIASVLVMDGNFAYKGATTDSQCGFCRIVEMFDTIASGFRYVVKTVIVDPVTKILTKVHPIFLLGVKVAKKAVPQVQKIATTSVSLGLSKAVIEMLWIHEIGNEIVKEFVDESDWHFAFEHITFTRDSIFENKKFYSIPRSDGTYDYVEVTINDDLSLNRDDALLITNGETRKLTKQETYVYFDEEYYSYANIPKKYQKHPIPL